MHKSDLLAKIEELRQELHRIASGRDFTDPEVIRVSHELDALLVKYQRLINNKQ